MMLRSNYYLEDMENRQFQRTIPLLHSNKSAKDILSHNQEDSHPFYVETIRNMTLFKCSSSLFNISKN